MASQDAEHHEVHSVEHYRNIWLLLLALFLVSVAGPHVAGFVENATAARVIVMVTAFGIALVKAFFVCRDFMHLNVQPKFVLYMLGAMLAMASLFFAAVAPDVMKHEGQNWTNFAAQAAVERGMEQGEVVHHVEEHAEDHGGEPAGGH